MNAALLQNAGFDYEHGVKRFLGRTALYEKTLSKFLQDGTFDRLRTAYAAHDAAQLLAHAHEFKGMCGNIALPPLHEAAAGLVTLLRGANSPAELDRAYARLEKEYRSASEAIQAAMRTPQ